MISIFDKNEIQNLDCVMSSDMVYVINQDNKTYECIKNRKTGELYTKKLSGFMKKEING